MMKLEVKVKNFYILILVILFWEINREIEKFKFTFTLHFSLHFTLHITFIYIINLKYINNEINLTNELSILYNFSYLFGLNAIKKYLAKKTIVTINKVPVGDVPFPALMVVPEWKLRIDPTLPCLQSIAIDSNLDFWSCVENQTFTYNIGDIVQNDTEAWEKTYQYFGVAGFLYTYNSSATITTDLENSFRLGWFKIGWTQKILKLNQYKINAQYFEPTLFVA